MSPLERSPRIIDLKSYGEEDIDLKQIEAYGKSCKPKPAEKEDIRKAEDKPDLLSEGSVQSK